MADWLHRLVCAQHRRELMACKSPVIESCQWHNHCDKY